MDGFECLDCGNLGSCISDICLVVMTDSVLLCRPLLFLLCFLAASCYHVRDCTSVVHSTFSSRTCVQVQRLSFSYSLE
jgi:hypothetical protein